MPTRVPPCRTPRLAAAGLLAALLAACGGTDPFAPRASLAVGTDELVVYPLGSAGVALPSAINLFNGIAVLPRLNGASPNFEVALDRAADGRVLVRTARTLLTAPGGSPRTGLLVAAGAFGNVTESPTSGFAYDSTLTVDIGRTVVVQTTGTVCSSTQPFNAKFVVDSVTSSGGFAITITTNPNCGFRSFATGVPTF